MTYTIRPAISDDFSFLPSIEKDAAQAFRRVGMDAIADMEPLSAEFYNQLPQQSCVLIAEDADGIAGFAVAKEVDGQAYLLEISVKLDLAGRGIGKALCLEIEEWAHLKSYSNIVLTTYRDVLFNAAFYRKIGFEIFVPDKQWPELSAICEMLAGRGLGNWPRVAMRKPL